jgi:hypothetical protein
VAVVLVREPAKPFAVYLDEEIKKAGVTRVVTAEKYDTLFTYFKGEESRRNSLI